MEKTKDKNIPVGLYCYEFLGFEKKEDSLSSVEGFISPYRIKIELCEYFIRKESINGFCSLINKKIDDMCKICGIKED